MPRVGLKSRPTPKRGIKSPKKTNPSLARRASVSGVTISPRPSVKAAAREVLDSVPDDITWEDLMYHLYVREKIEIGLRQLDAGDVFEDEDVFRELLDEAE